MRHRDLWTASLLGFVAGYTTSNTKVRFDTFGGMMTGNTVKLGISIAQGQWAWTGVFAACIACFALGTFAALFMIKRIEARRGQHLFLLVFCACFFLVDAVALAVDKTPRDYDIYASLASSLVAFAMGAQNLLSQKSSLVKANTTFMTGNIQKMTEALWNRWVEEDGLTRAQRRAALLLFCTWTNYIVGGVCGAAIAPVFFWSLTPVAVLYAIGMISMQIEPAPPPDKEAREDVELRPRL